MFRSKTKKHGLTFERNPFYFYFDANILTGSFFARWTGKSQAASRDRWQIRESQTTCSPFLRLPCSFLYGLIQHRIRSRHTDQECVGKQIKVTFWPPSPASRTNTHTDTHSPTKLDRSFFKNGKLFSLIILKHYAFSKTLDTKQVPVSNCCYLPVF